MCFCVGFLVVTDLMAMLRHIMLRTVILYGTGPELRHPVPGCIYHHVLVLHIAICTILQSSMQVSCNSLKFALSRYCPPTARAQAYDILNAWRRLPPVLR